MAVTVSYDVLRGAMRRGSKDINGPGDFERWAVDHGFEAGAVETVASEVAEMAVKDMQDGRGLNEALMGAYLAGFVGVFELLRQGVADETFEYIAQGDKVVVNVSKVTRQE